MRHFKLTFLLTILMSMVGARVFAYEFYKDGIYYDWDGPGLKVTYISYDGDNYETDYSGNVVIPSSVSYLGRSYSVTSIGEHAFYGCNTLESVTIPSSIKNIYYEAFGGWDGMSFPSIYISDIKAWCEINFYSGIGRPYLLYLNGNLLTELSIPSGVTSIKNDTFVNCSNDITSIIIPEGVTTIGEYAFSLSNMNNYSVTIPSSVISIGYNAFYGNYGGICNAIYISDLSAWCEITDNGSCLHDHAIRLFLNEEEITDLVISNGVTSIGENAFKYCTGLTSVSLPNSLTNIGRSAFEDCSGLTSIIIPNSITTIGSFAFDCSNLISVTVEKEEPIAIGNYTFSNRTNATLYVPYGSKSEYKAANYWKEFKEIKETKPEEINLSISDAGIGTYCSDFDLDFTSTNVKAYIVSAFTPSTGKVIMTRIYDVPANTGIVIKGDEGDFQIPTKNAETVVANMLVGVTEDTALDKEVGDYTNYILAKKAGEVGFYAVADGSTLKANKAYLPLQTASLPVSARVAIIFDDEGNTTGIVGMKQQSPKTNGIVYNLNGQRQNGLKKGLNIVDGMKVIVK